MRTDQAKKRNVMILQQYIARDRCSLITQGPLISTTSVINAKMQIKTWRVFNVPLNIKRRLATSRLSWVLPSSVTPTRSKTGSTRRLRTRALHLRTNHWCATNRRMRTRPPLITPAQVGAVRVLLALSQRVASHVLRNCVTQHYLSSHETWAWF